MVLVDTYWHFGTHWYSEDLEKDEHCDDHEVKAAIKGWSGLVRNDERNDDVMTMTKTTVMITRRMMMRRGRILGRRMKTSMKWKLLLRADLDLLLLVMLKRMMMTMIMIMIMKMMMTTVKWKLLLRADLAASLSVAASLYFPLLLQPLKYL